jgi:hypothetical protein
LTANGITLADGADPIEAAIGAIKDLGQHATAARRQDPWPTLSAANHPIRRSRRNEAAARSTADPLCSGTLARVLETAIASRRARRRSPPADERTEGEIAAIARADKAEGELAAELEEEVKELNADVEDAMSEKNRLANELAAAVGQLAAGVVDEQAEEAPPAPLERVRPETARDVGPPPAASIRRPSSTSCSPRARSTGSSSCSPTASTRS